MTNNKDNGYSRVNGEIVDVRFGYVYNVFSFFLYKLMLLKSDFQ